MHNGDCQERISRPGMSHFSRGMDKSLSFDEVKGKLIFVCEVALAMLKKSNLTAPNMLNWMSSKDECFWIKVTLFGGVWMANNPVSQDHILTVLCRQDLW